MPKTPKIVKTPNSKVSTPAAEAKLADRRQQVLKQARKFARPLRLNRKKFLIFTSAILASLAVIALTVLGVLIYRYKNDSELVYRISKVAPYPAARVNGQFITYGDYLFELSPLKHYYQNPGGPTSGERQPVDFSTPEGKQQLIELQNLALGSAKQKVIIEQLADEHKIKISDRELDDVVNESISREGGKEKFVEAIKFFYGWDLNDFREVMRNQLLQRKLQPVLSGDQRKKAEEILTRAQNGEDFTALAKQYSEDPGSQENGGDLGFASRGAYVKEFEDAAFALQPSAISSLVETQFGFHILKNLEVKGDQIRIAHILIKYVDLENIVKQKLDKGETKTYIKIEPNPQPPADQPLPSPS